MPRTGRPGTGWSNWFAGGLLTGCTGEEGSGGEPTTTRAGTEGAPGGATESTTATEPGRGDDGNYAVTMAPMGEVTFDAVPRRVYTGLPNTADMAIAAGRADAVDAIYYPEYHGTLLNHFYDRLDGVSLDWTELTDSRNLGKEGFYELDSDVHLTDPAYAATLDSLDATDVAEIGEQVGPWFGNYYSDRHRTPPQAGADDYRYYTLWEIFGKVARVFREGERARRLADVHASMRSTLSSNLPPTGERPTVALTFKWEGNTF
jgi:hypothetical protein